MISKRDSSDYKLLIALAHELTPNAVSAAIKACTTAFTICTQEIFLEPLESFIIMDQFKGLNNTA